MSADTVNVPRVATDEMHHAGQPLMDTHNASDVWSAMLAASPSVGGWEDISTAPKDGTSVMVSAPGCGVSIVRWMLDVWIDEQGFTQAKWPTHWMPLPPPPSVSIDNGSRPQEAVPTEQAEPAVVGDRTEMLEKALELALGYLVKFEPGDSRAVSDEYVAMLAVLCRVRPNEPGGEMAIIEKALARLSADGCSSNEGAGS